MPKSVSLDHHVNSISVPTICQSPLSDYAKLHYDILGLQYIPIFKDGTIYYVLKDTVQTVCEKYGLILGRKTRTPDFTDRVDITGPSLHLEDFYKDIPPSITEILAIHSIRYVQCEYHSIQIWVYEKSMVDVCKRFGTATDPSKVLSQQVTIPIDSISLQDCLQQLSPSLQHYYELMGVLFVCAISGRVDVSTKDVGKVYIPVKYLDLVAKRIGAFV